MSTTNPLPFGIKQGQRSALPTASLETAGTIFFCTDTGELYIDYLDADGQPQRRLILQSELNQINNELNDLDTTKMDKLNPIGTGSFSFNRDSETETGEYSVAIGYGVEASGAASYAEGGATTASGAISHAEGYATKAKGDYQHTQGKYNIEDTASAHLVGNGESNTNRSNAHTLDWDGNAWFAGDVYVGSTLGINKDAGSKRLVKESTKLNATISATGWSNDTIPTYTFEDSNITPTSAIELIPAINITANQYEALQDAQIIGGAQSNGSIVLRAMGSKPTINIPVIIIIRGDL